MTLRFKKCHQVHAISDFQAIVRFLQPLNAAEFPAVSGVLETVSESLELPARLATPTFAVQFGDPSGGQFTPNPMSGLPLAAGFQRFAANGEIAERLSADLQSVSYMTQDYRGWENTRSTIKDHLAKVAAEYTRRSCLVAGILVQYTNLFHSEELGPVSATEVFRPGLRWVPSVAEESNDFWHSHVGMFLHGDGKYKKLVNVNVDVAPDAVGRTQVRLLILASHQFASTGSQPLALTASETPDVLLGIFDQAHDLEKRVLNEVLSDEYLKAVQAT